MEKVLAKVETTNVTIAPSLLATADEVNEASRPLRHQGKRRIRNIAPLETRTVEPGEVDGLVTDGVLRVEQ
jgi:hypothetical protein